MLDTIHTLFNHPGLRRFFLKLRVPLMLIVIGLLAYYARREWLWPALAISLGGELIQVWAFASLVKNDMLTARGPYVLVRNPMYLGRLVMMLGLVLLLGNPYIAGAFVVLYYFYMVNRVKREEAKLGPGLGRPYHDYCARTNRFWPTWSRLNDPNLRFFDVGVLVNNHGHWNLLANLILYAAFAVYILYLR